MQNDFINVSEHKNTKAFGENIYFYQNDKAQCCFYASDVLNGVDNPRRVFLAHKDFEENFKMQYFNVNLPGLEKKVIPKSDIDVMLQDEDYHVYAHMDNDYPFPAHLMRGDGQRIVKPFLIEQDVLNDRKYILDAFLEKLVMRNNLWIASTKSQWSDDFNFLKMPAQPDDEEQLAGVIENFNLNRHCEGLESDYCEAFSCVVDLTQEEIERVQEFCQRINTRSLTMEEQKHDIYTIDRFVAYDVLGGKEFVIPIPEEPKRRFKR